MAGIFLLRTPDTTGMVLWLPSQFHGLWYTKQNELQSMVQETKSQ